MRTIPQWRTGAAAAIIRGILIGLLLSAVFIAGFVIRDIPAVNSFLAHAQGTVSTTKQYPLLAEVQGRIDENFRRDQPDQKQLEDAAIRGLLNALNDKYTFFVEPPVAHSESYVLAGKDGGRGDVIAGWRTMQLWRARVTLRQTG